MKLVIPNTVHQKIMHWVNKSSYEVSGLGKIQAEQDGTMTVLDVMLLPQKNASTHTDIEAEDVGKAMFLLKDTPGDLRFWWHSHVNMNVFWSGTDRDTIKLCGQGGWCVASVFNKKNEVRTAFYSVHGMLLPWGREELFYDDIKTEVSPVSPELVKAWDLEYDNNVKIQQWSSSGKGESKGAGGTTILTGDTSNLSKKEQKRVKRLQKQIEEQHRQTAIELDRTTPDEPTDFFDETDKMVMRAMGYTDDQINWLSEDDYFSPQEVMDMVHAGWCAAEIMWASEYAEKKDLSADDMMLAFTPQSERAKLKSSEYDSGGAA